MIELVTFNLSMCIFVLNMYGRKGNANSTMFNHCLFIITGKISLARETEFLRQEGKEK